MENLAKFESDLWEAADNLRANSKLTSSDYFMPVLGIIFLRHAANRFDAATEQIAADQAAGRMPKRKILPADYIRRRALYLPEAARFDSIMAKATTDPAGLPSLVTDAMTAIEADFEPLANVLPKDYGIFEPKVLEELMRLFNSEQIKRATGDVFGRIYEYFLAKFSIQKAHDNGEFFTPSSLVQLIVNVIEPDHGNVFDPACGSGGMFVQSSHFIEHTGGDTTKKVVFYGQEKNRDTIRIAKMNLAVHGLEGKIAEAITYYQDEHSLAPAAALAPGACDFVMANPPFNVDLVDAERIKNDPRLPFGLPGVNKDKRVSNGNYLWISYFYSYLSETGRAGFVMSSQASSAGNDEKTVRQKLVETGAVDVMISIKGGFFYTRTVPCELWHFDRNKPAGRKDQVLMLDARSIGQLMKGSRKVHEFTPEQMRNLTAIVWLYRGQRKRFLALVLDYFQRHAIECAAVPDTLAAFDTAIAAIDAPFAALAKTVQSTADLDTEKTQLLTDILAELRDARKAYDTDAKSLLAELAACERKTGKSPPATNDAQHAARKAFDPVAERIKGLIKQVDLLYKLACRAASTAADLAEADAMADAYDRRTTGKLIKQLDEARRAAAEQLKHATYFHRHIVWLQDRFPEAAIQPVRGLVEVVTRKEIEAADWSLTPGRYVGVAPPEVDETFDFELAISEIHEEIAGLNAEAVELAATIQKNLESLGA
jgi:type I restriction enzyme M protein